MKNLLFLLFSVLVFGQKIENIKLNSKILNQEREIWVYTPFGFDENTSQKYDVIYVFDAQAREYFDLVHSAINFYNEGMFPMVVVGIASPFDEKTKQSRNTDLLPKPENDKTTKKYNGYLGNADNFFRFLSDEVSPFLEKNYRTTSSRIAVGHSNGGTFISHCFLEKPEFFNAYILVSPNYEYDDFQLAKRFQNFNFNQLNSKKFFYLCNANEAKDFGKDWEKGNLEVAKILQEKATQNKIKFINQDFSKSETHGSIPPIGISLGLKNYMAFFTNSDNFLEKITKNETITLDADQVNSLAYSAHEKGKTKNAVKILLWANQKFPENFNIYDSIGEMYQNLGDKANAEKYYKMLGEKIETVKNTLKPEEYLQLKDGVKGRLDYLKKMK